MPTLKIQPIQYRDEWHSKLAKLIYSIFYQGIFKPILDILDDPERSDNARTTALESALKRGDIQFKEGAFIGKVNAAISKEIKGYGGKFVRGSWRLASPSLPPHIQNAIHYNVRMMEMFQLKVNNLFDKMPKTVTAMIENMNVKKMGLEGLNRVSIEFKHRLNKAVSVYPDLGTKGKKGFNLEYNETTTKPIKEKLLSEYEDGIIPPCRDFAQEIVEDLRRDLHNYVMGGRPRGEIKDFIAKRLGVSETRATFIARQETALMTVAFTKQQYANAGVNKYEWVTAGDHVVRGNRPDDSGNHKVLHGKIFAWDAPPGAEHFSTKEPCHPGEDYRCRCVAKPIVEW